MPNVTNFPNGVSSFGVPVFGSNLYGQPLTGTVLWVDTVNGVDAGSGNGPNNAFQTLTYALTQLPSSGYESTSYTIMVLPGSTITISSATALTISTANVNIVGVGVGDERPLFDFTTANTATIAVSAAKVGFYNCRFRGSFLSIAAAFTLTTAASFTLDGNLFYDASGVLNFLNIVKSTGAANTIDNITLSNNVWKSLGTTSVNSFLLSANDIDGATLLYNTVTQVTTVDAAILVTVSAGVLTNFSAGFNKGYRKNTTTANGSLVNVGGTTSTGFVFNNYVQTLTTTADKLFTTTVGLAAFNNYVTGVVGASGFLIPTADS